MIEQRVTLRYDAQQIPAIVQAVQGDTGRDVIFELADYEIPAGATANYYIDKPDDTAIYNSADVISSTEILAHLTEQALAVPGRNNGQVRILSDGEVITSFDFVLEVEAFRGILHMQSETEVNIFDAAIQEAVDDAIEEIQAQTPVVTGMQNSIAPTYSSSSTYAVGDYVMYNAQLYKCITAITTEEAWTAAHWTQVPLADDVNDLKSALSDIEEITVKTTEHTETTDITSDLTFTDGYMNTSGQTGASSSYKYTNKISVAEGDVILSGSNAYNLRYITAYSGDTVVSAKGADNVSTYTVPSEIDSVIVTIYSAVGTTSNAVLHTTTVIERENILNDTVNAIEGEIDSVNDRVDVIESLTIVEDVDVTTTDLTPTLTFTDGYVDADGNIGSSTSYKYTEHIPVSEGDVIFTVSGSYSLRYITAYNGDNVESGKSASNVLTYTVPSGVDSVIVTVYSATDLVAGTVKKTVTTVETRNINDEAISEIKNNTIYEKTTSTDITASLTFTNGYVNKQGLVVSGSSTYKYSARISVSEGDVFSTAEYPFRYVTAYNGTAIEAKSAEAVMSYTVPSGISEVILTMYIASTRGVMKGVKEPYNLFYNSLSHKNVGYFEKPYICLSCDDGADELATYTIPMIISKGVPCTFGLYKTSPVFQHGHTQTVVNAVNNNNCEIAQHGGQHSWTDYNAEELVAFFDDEELFWKSIDVDVKSAIYPTHLSNPMVRAITGSRFGCCRSGYNYDGILFYDDESKPSGMLPYYGTGARSNLYAMSSWNMPAGKDLQFAKNCIDWAIANNKLIHFYWHDWDLDSVSKQVLEDTIDYAKTQSINFIKLSEVPYIK